MLIKRQKMRTEMVIVGKSRPHSIEQTTATWPIFYTLLNFCSWINQTNQLLLWKVANVSRTSLAWALKRWSLRHRVIKSTFPDLFFVNNQCYCYHKTTPVDHKYWKVTSVGSVFVAEFLFLHPWHATGGK